MLQKTEAVINWVKEQFKNIPDGKAIIGISGGKDSTIAAALCVEALGADRVRGVLMPNGIQEDIQDSIWVCQLLGIEYEIINIQGAYESLLYHIGFPAHASVPNIIKTNMPARLRMTTLYAVAGLFPNARVINTCNWSEDYVGYSTKYGDAAGDISPLGNLTVREVLEIGDDLHLPYKLVHKVPSDGMCGKSDEDNLGFTYEELDNYILNTGEVSDEVKEKIQKLHNSTRHKYKSIPTFYWSEGDEF